MFYICFDQMQNNLISQAGQMETNGTPNDLLPAMNQVGCIVLGPFIQEVLYPFLHRRRIYLMPITRIAIGFGFVTLSMLYATIVQQVIYNAPPCYNQPGHCGPNQVNVWVQAPLYFLISTGEIFAYVTALEYAYDHSPKTMKVVVQAVGLLAGGVGSAGALALTPIAHDPYLVIFYASLTGGMAAVTAVFWLVFQKYNKKQAIMENETALSNATVHLENCGFDYLANRVSETAPIIGPIETGGRIEIPSTINSRASSATEPRSQVPSQAPTIPRKMVKASMSSGDLLSKSSYSNHKL